MKQGPSACKLLQALRANMHEGEGNSQAMAQDSRQAKLTKYGQELHEPLGATLTAPEHVRCLHDCGTARSVTTPCT